jgi:hypothetical protein
MTRRLSRLCQRGIIASVVVPAVVVPLGLSGGSAAASTARPRTVYLACGTERDPIPHTKRIAPQSCIAWAYAVDIDQYVYVRFGQLHWRHWGQHRATARGKFTVGPGSAASAPVTLTAYGPLGFGGRVTGTFYQFLQIVDHSVPGFIGPSRGFTLSMWPFEDQCPPRQTAPCFRP